MAGRRCCFSISLRLYRPPSVAVVGGGPAGFYAADRILRKSPDAMVTVFDRCPFPFGLVRFGVAPDHPDVKNVIHKFDALMQANPERIRFFGGVDVLPAENLEIAGGFPEALQFASVPILDLIRAHDATILSHGAQADRPLDLDGEDVAERNGRVLSARPFVNWYNALPGAEAPPVLSQGAKKIAILGVGNVAVDVARTIALARVAGTAAVQHVPEEKEQSKSKREFLVNLEDTDINRTALGILKGLGCQQVDIFARRAAEHASFTIKEFRELIKLATNGLIRLEFHEGPSPRADPKAVLPQRRRLLELLYASMDCNPTNPLAASLSSITIAFHFEKVPRLISYDEGRNYASVQFGDGSWAAANLIVRSIGYRVTPLLTEDTVKTLQNVFLSGWARTGPVGTIVTTMSSAHAAAEEALDYLSSNELHTLPPLQLTPAHSSATDGRIANWNSWKELEQIELAGGKALHCAEGVKQKITDIDAIVSVVRACGTPVGDVALP